MIKIVRDNMSGCRIGTDVSLDSLWKQARVPVLFRRQRHLPLLLRIPWREDNKEWVRGGSRTRPRWNPQYSCWEIPISWFEDIAQRTVMRYGSLYLVQEYRESQKCAPACWNATGLHCECSCMGENHGMGDDGRWFVLSDICAVRRGQNQYSCRLVKLKAS